MITLLQRKSLKFFHPILKRMVKIYLSKPRNFTYEDIRLKIMPGVFHPGLFFSTKVFIEFLDTLKLKGKRILELGAGSGLISIYCARQNGIVTSSDINRVALDALKKNASQNGVELEITCSDLFDNLSIRDYDLILINPPYYPQTPTNIEEQAWYCGEGFEYFEKLFAQLKEVDNNVVPYMILSQDCDIKKIMQIASDNNIEGKVVFDKRVGGERNMIYLLKKVRFV